MKQLLDAIKLQELNIRLCKKIEKQIGSPANNADVQTIVYGVSRGGLIPAVYISHHFNDIDIGVIAVKSYDGTNRGKIKVLKPLPDITELKKYERVIIVDDIIDSGATLDYILRHFNNLKKENNLKTELLTCALIQGNKARVKVDCAIITDNALWVVFPYELNNG